MQADPSNFEALCSLARLWLAAGRVQAAVECAQQAVSGQPDEVAALQLLGDCQLAAGQWEAALESYRSALTLCSEVSLKATYCS